MLFLPEVVITANILILFALLCFKPNHVFHKSVCYLAYIMIFLGAYAMYIALCKNSIVKNNYFFDSYTIDKLDYFLKGFITSAAGIIILYTKTYLLRFNIFKLEFFLLLLLSVLGQMICIGAIHTLSLYLGIELMALAIYGLVVFRYTEHISIEAGIKYMILGAIASAFLLYGISMVYGATNALSYSAIIQSIQNQTYDRIMLLLGMIFIIAALLFKLGLVPFHMWVPDVYEGGIMPSTLVISSIPKVAIVILFYRLMHDVFYSLSANYIEILQYIAIISLFVANLAAITQKNIKRMLAYSTISHIAFMCLAIIVTYVANYEIMAKQMLIFYLLTYTLTSITIFGLLLGLTQFKDNLAIADLKGLAKKHPIVSVALLLCMFSLAGIPPTMGFYSKFMVIQGLMHNHYYIIAILAILSSVIAAFYYLLIVKTMYFDDLNAELPSFQHSISAKISLGLSLCLIMLLGIYPNTLMSILSKVVI
jgi:NADH-quinone oxidoreductase subunit N